MTRDRKPPVQKSSLHRTSKSGMSFLLLFLNAAVSSAQPVTPMEAGIWFDDTGKGAIELSPCGTKLCGRIIWLKDPLNTEGKPLVDRFNPNPSQRSSPICGLQILGGLQPMPEGTWDIGWIYDPKTGKAYDATVQLLSSDKLKVTGYKGVKLFSKSFIWTRAPSDLPRCKVNIAETEENNTYIPSPPSRQKANR